MKTWTQAMRDSVAAGKLAGLATAATAALCGKVELDNAVAPLNAVSHIVWGEEAFGADTASLKYTLMGLVLNDAANGSWAAIYEVLFGEAADDGKVAPALLGGALVAGGAYVIDYYLVPKRLTPGLEKRLSARSLLAVYAALALSLGIGGVWRRS